MMKFKCLVGSFLFAVTGCGQNSSSDGQFSQAEDAQLKENIATVINLNGHLCAQVVWIGPKISSGEHAGQYQVNCEEYRDPSGATSDHNLVVYMVDPGTNTVRLMGR